MSALPKATPNAKPTQNQSDVEKLRELKMTILRGQHPVFRPNPNPDVLSQLFLGPHPAAQVNSGPQSKKPSDAQGNFHTDSKSPIVPLSATSSTLISKAGLDSRSTRPDPAPVSRPAQTSDRDRLREVSSTSRQPSTQVPPSSVPVRNGESYLRPGATSSSTPTKPDAPKSSITAAPPQSLAPKPNDRVLARPRSPTIPSPPAYSSLRPLGRLDPKESTGVKRDTGSFSYDSPRNARQESPKLRREGVPSYDPRSRQDSREPLGVRHEVIPTSYDPTRSRPETRNVSPPRRDSGPSHDPLGRPVPLSYSDRRSSWDRSPPRRSSTALEYHPFETRIDRERSHERGRYERERERTQEPPRRPEPIDTRLSSYISRNPASLEQRDSRDLSPDMRRNQVFASVQDPIRGRPESTRPLDVRGLDRISNHSSTAVMRAPHPPTTVARHDAPPPLTPREMMPPPIIGTRAPPSYAVPTEGRRSVMPESRGPPNPQRDVPFPTHTASTDGRRSVMPDSSGPMVPADDLRRQPAYTERRQVYPLPSAPMSRPESRGSIQVQPPQSAHVPHTFPTTHAPPHSDPNSVLGPIVRPPMAAEADDTYDPRRPANGIIQQRQHSLDSQPIHDPRRFPDAGSRVTTFRDLPPRPADELHPTPMHEAVPLREPQPLPREATVLHDISLPTTIAQHSQTQPHQHQSSLPIPPASASLPAPPPPQLQMQRSDDPIRWARDDYNRPDLRDEYDHRPRVTPLQATPMHSLDPRDYYERAAQPSNERDITYERPRETWEQDAWREYADARERSAYGEVTTSPSVPLRSATTQQREYYYDPQPQPSDPSSWGIRTRPRSTSPPHPDDERPYKRFRQGDRDHEFEYDRLRERGALVGHDREYSARNTYAAYAYDDVERRDAYPAY